MTELEFAKHNGFLYHLNNYQPTYKRRKKDREKYFAV